MIPTTQLIRARVDTRIGRFVQRQFSVVVFLCFAVVIGIVYAPSLTAYFVSDDFTYVATLMFNIRSLLAGQNWDAWFLGGIDGYVYFRPIGHTFMLLDYLMWGLNSWGYHLTNTILHLMATFMVFLLARLLTRRQVTAIATASLFAILPVHAEAVSWIAARYDVLAGFFFFASLTFFIIYRRKHALQFYLVSLIMFVFSLSSKETAIVFPLVVLLYDIIFIADLSHPIDLLKRNLPFWLVLVGYLIFRIDWIGRIGYRGFRSIPEGWWYWVDGSLLSLINPFLSDMTSSIRWLLIGIAVLLLLIYRSRREVIFGLIWMPITLIATATSGPSDRSAYIASLGLCLVLASILTQPIAYRDSIARAIGFAILLLLAVIYSGTLVVQNQAYHQAGEVAAAIPKQVAAMHPTLAPDARLVFVGVPDQVPAGPLVYITGLPGSLQMIYRSPTLQVDKFGKYPIWLDKLDQTFFFQVDHRRVTERQDLIEALKKRKQCESYSRVAVEWNFSEGVQGWEAWNQLTTLTVSNGTLLMHSEGSDPYMASPEIEIPTMEVGAVEIEMRASGIAPLMQGAVYWLATGQRDFSPALKMLFSIQADGGYHVYRVDLTASGALLMGDQVLRLRLDPANAPADIAIKSIRVYAHCATLLQSQCECVP
jgi:hypothetical protein